ncbi:tRNA (N(6)-L-threonylcarbamoyladenosine(37)-C(2))-methylthiotransferase [archaeon]|nr:tRNA (N(6)-L-threonylcarbamoyladenosine(37)-C(2))-methylthiotransferase [archaeon]
MKKIAFVTYGCSLNHSDSEVMHGLLEKHGFKITNTKDADLIVVNSCTVKNQAESKFFRTLKKFEDKKIVIAGCIPQADAKLRNTELKDYSIVGISQINKIAEVVEETFNGNVVHLLKREKNPRLNIPKIRKNKIIEIIPINEGCLGNCSYCKTIQARGRLISYEIKEIKKQMQDAVKDGCKEIWLTSQDTSCYGKDINTNIIELLNELVKVKGKYTIRLGMGNPTYFLSYLKELTKLFLNNKMFRFLHIPVQSGNNRILKEMNRDYKVEDYVKIVNYLRNELPYLTISTDIIVAFPGETKKEFEDSVKLIKETKPDIVNISRYWARPGTLAAKMKQVGGDESKRRAKELIKVFREVALERNKEWLNWKGSIVINEKGKNNTFVGRNLHYKPVIVKKGKIGEWQNIEIKKVTCYDLRTF